MPLWLSPIRFSRENCISKSRAQNVQFTRAILILNAFPVYFSENNTRPKHVHFCADLAQFTISLHPPAQPIPAMRRNVSALFCPLIVTCFPQGLCTPVFRYFITQGVPRLRGTPHPQSTQRLPIRRKLVTFSLPCGPTSKAMSPKPFARFTDCLRIAQPLQLAPDTSTE